MALVLLSACARLDYDAVGIHHSVVRGGQAQIDAGNVVDVVSPVDLPGIWLAGHRSTHGSVFANLVNARVGDRVCVYSTCFTVFDTMRRPPGWRRCGRRSGCWSTGRTGPLGSSRSHRPTWACVTV